MSECADGSTCEDLDERSSSNNNASLDVPSTSTDRISVNKLPTVHENSQDVISQKNEDPFTLAASSRGRSMRSLSIQEKSCQNGSPSSSTSSTNSNGSGKTLPTHNQHKMRTQQTTDPFSLASLSIGRSMRSIKETSSWVSSSSSSCGESDLECSISEDTRESDPLFSLASISLSRSSVRSLSSIETHSVHSPTSRFSLCNWREEVVQWITALI
jgi:hypothetical protein